MQECKLLALHQMVQRFAQIVDKVTWVTSESPQDDDAVNSVATLYHNKAHGALNPACHHLSLAGKLAWQLQQMQAESLSAPG